MLAIYTSIGTCDDFALFGSRMHKISKVRQGNLERGVTWNVAHSSAPYSRTGTVRLTSWDGIGRNTSALSYHGLQVSDS